MLLIQRVVEYYVRRHLCFADKWHNSIYELILKLPVSEYTLLHYGNFLIFTQYELRGVSLIIIENSLEDFTDFNCTLNLFYPVIFILSLKMLLKFNFKGP